jgi:hypothetical protein
MNDLVNHQINGLVNPRQQSGVCPLREKVINEILGIESPAQKEMPKNEKKKSEQIAPKENQNGRTK